MFVSVDTLSARHTSLYGYQRPTTPGLDRLAESSVVFERCWANAPWTTPSYMSQFTGLYAAAFRRPERGDEDESDWAFADAHRTLAELFRDAGYRTAGFVDNHNVGPHLGFDQGFEVYDDSAAHLSALEPHGGIDHVVPLALAWLDGLESAEPFFLFVQVLDVHGPYVSAGSFAGTFGDAPTPVADRRVPVALEHDSILGAIPLYVAEPVQEDGAGELRVRPLLDAYDEGIRALDDALGRFLAELDARGVLDRALLVLSADHGESLVEHESYFDHQLLHGEELHVPLLLRPPGGTAPRRIETDVQLVDLYPTLAALVGIEVRGELSGRSLLPALAGEPLPSTPSIAFADFGACRSIALDGWKLVETNPSLESMGPVGFLSAPRTRAWIAGRFPEFEGKVFGTQAMPPSMLDGVDADALFAEAKGELLGPFRALYDLASDPGELEDVSAAHPERVRALLALLDEAGPGGTEPGSSPNSTANRERGTQRRGAVLLGDEPGSVSSFACVRACSSSRCSAPVPATR